jgi:hypothetical protein
MPSKIEKVNDVIIRVEKLDPSSNLDEYRYIQTKSISAFSDVRFSAMANKWNINICVNGEDAHYYLNYDSEIDAKNDLQKLFSLLDT